jgi:hypothetical protein
MSIPNKRKILAGCYIDFEGFAPNEHRATPPPVLIGIYREGEFKQVVFTGAYRWAASDQEFGNVHYESDRKQYLKELADSTSKGKPLFAYSEHEKNVIEHQIGHQITARYKNVRKIAKSYFNRYPDRFPEAGSIAENSLSAVTQVLGFKLKHKLPRGGVTKRLRNVRQFSDSRKKWAAAPDGIKQQWREVLLHNREDAMCLFDILMALRTRQDGA